MATLRDILASFQIKIDTKGLKKLDRGLEKSKKSTQGLFDAMGGLRTIVAGAAAAFTGGVFANFVNGALDAADAIDKMSGRIGIASDEAQILSQFAAEAGTSAQGMEKALKGVARQALAATEGSKIASQAFDELGIELTDDQGELKGMIDLLFEVGGALSEVESGTRRMGLAQVVAGQAGVNLLTNFRDGKDAALALREELREVAIIYDKEFVAQSAVAVDQMSRLRLQFEAVRVSIVSRFLPGLIRTVTKLQPLVKSFAAWARSSQAARLGTAALTLALGGLAVLKFRGLLTALGLLRKAMLRFLIPVAIIEDLWVTLRGGKSVTRDVIDSLFGIGTTEAVVKDLKAAWDAFYGFLKEEGPKALKAVGEAFDDLKDGATKAAKGIQSAFAVAVDGTELALNDIQDIWDLLFEGMFDSGESFGEKLGNNIDFWLVAPFLAAIEGIKSAFDFVNELGLQLQEDFSESVINPIVDGIKTFALEFGLLVHDAMTSPFETALGVIRGIVDTVKDLAGGVGGLITGGLELAKSAIEFRQSVGEGLLSSQLGQRFQTASDGAGPGAPVPMLPATARTSSTTNRTVNLTDRRTTTFSGIAGAQQLQSAERRNTMLQGRDRRATLAGINGG